MLYCDHKPLTPFFTTGMSSPVLDRWALELQQLDIKFKHIQGKKNVVAYAVSRLRMLCLYQDYDSDNVQITTENVIKNIIEEVHSTDVVPRTPAYNIGKLNLEVLRKEQQWDRFCKNKVKEMKKKPDPNFLLYDNNILRKVVKQIYYRTYNICSLENTLSLL